MKHFRHIFIILLILSIGLLASCSQASYIDATPKNDAPVSIPKNSILGCAKDESIANLANQIAKGEYPAEVAVQYDSVDGCLKATVTDPETIKLVCQQLILVEVTGKCDESITDNYHSISFKQPDGSFVTFSFEGEHIWCLDGQNYSIENSAKLFALMRELVDASRSTQG